jgi:NDP-sugar pyrophosphorylase family protein
MKALILAGGLGTRLRSIVNDRPKPMARVGNKPFLEYLLEFLKIYQINELIFCIGYMSQNIREYFGDGSLWSVKIDYSVENDLLGTGGAIKNAESFLDGTFLTLNGDSFFEINLDELLQFHNEKKMEIEGGFFLGTVALTKVQHAQNFGSVILDQDNRILQFSEKEERKATDGISLVNAGIYVLEPVILNNIPVSQKASIESEIFPSLLEAGYYLGGFLTDGVFVDIGTPEGYGRFRDFILGRNS